MLRKKIKHFFFRPKPIEQFYLKNNTYNSYQTPVVYYHWSMIIGLKGAVDMISRYPLPFNPIPAGVFENQDALGGVNSPL